MANVSVSNTPGLYIGSGASSVLNSAQQLLSLLSNQGNVNFSLATGNSTVQGYFIGNVGGTYSNANVAAYLPVNSANVAGSYFIGDGSQLTNLPIGPSSYGNANVAAYLPTYTGSLALSSTIIDLYSNAATQATSINTINANLGAYQTYANANAASQATSINTINANLGAFETYANATFGTSNYSNVNVAAYLPTYTGSLALSSTIVDLYSNAASQQTSINAINANLGAFQTYSNVTNAATQANIGTLFLGNASTNANLGAFQTYANATFGTSSYSNVQVTAFLPTYSGNIGNVNIKSGTQYHYGGNLILNANVASSTGGALSLYAGNAAGLIGGTINLNASQINIGGDYYGSDLVTFNSKTIFTGAVGNNLGANIVTFSQANVNVSKVGNYGGFMWVGGTVNAGKVVSTDGYFWANGTVYSTPSSYGNANVAAYLPTYSGQLGGNLNIGPQPGITGIGPNPNDGVMALYANGSLIQGNANVITFSAGIGTTQPGEINLIANNTGSPNPGDINITAGRLILTSGGVFNLYGNPTVRGNLSVTNNGAASPSDGWILSNVGGIIANTTQTNVVVLTGNAGVTWANGVQYGTSFGSTYGNTQVAAYLLTNTGNVSAGYFIGDGSQLTSVPVWADYQGQGFLTMTTDSYFIGGENAAFIGKNNFGGATLGYVDSVFNTGFISGAAAFMSGNASDSNDENGVIVPDIASLPFQQNASIVTNAIYDTWGNVYIKARDDSLLQSVIYTFSNVGIVFPDGTVQSTAGGGGGSNFTSNLTVNGNYIIDANLSLARDQVANIGTILGTTTINANIGQIQTAVVSGNITINTNNFTNFLPGQSVTIKLRQATNANLRILTSNVIYAGGSKTLSTANAAIDTITITYDGEDYLGALVKGYS